MSKLYRLPVDGRPSWVVEEDGSFFHLDGEPASGWRPGRPVTVDPRHPLAPLRPRTIVGIGRNYRDHAAERSKPVPTEPLVFLKPVSALIGPGEPIVLPPASIGRVDYEAELAVVIGSQARKVTAEHAFEHVLGYTCVNDVTARGLQDRGFQFSHAKGFDTFCPIGPVVLLSRERRPFVVEGLVNGEIRQRESTEQLIFDIATLIAYVTSVMTLEAGDVIATGTPAGVGPLAAGDIVTVRIEGIGELTNPVVQG